MVTMCTTLLYTEMSTACEEAPLLRALHWPRFLIAHRDTLVLTNVEFKVSKAGQERVRREKQKNVHAYVIGNYIGHEVCNMENYELVYYNPFVTDTFVTVENNIPILKAEKCSFVNVKCYVER